MVDGDDIHDTVSPEPLIVRVHVVTAYVSTSIHDSHCSLVDHFRTPSNSQALTATGFDDASAICTRTNSDLIRCGVGNLADRRKMTMSMQHTIQSQS